MHNVEIPATDYVRVYLDSSVNGGRGMHALLVLGFGGGYFHQADPWEAENRSLVRLRVLSFLCVLHVDGRARSPCAHTCSFILPLGLIGHFHLRLGSGVCSFHAVNLVPGLNQPDKASPRSHDLAPFAGAQRLRVQHRDSFPTRLRGQLIAAMAYTGGGVPDRINTGAKVRVLLTSQCSPIPYS